MPTSSARRKPHYKTIRYPCYFQDLKEGQRGPKTIFGRLRPRMPPNVYAPRPLNPCAAPIKQEDLATSTMSPNLQLALGLTPAPKGSVVTTGGGETGGSSWQPPSFSGLANSKPLTTLKPVVIGSNSTGLQVEYKKGASRDGGQGGDDGDEWSEEEGWDYEGMHRRKLVHHYLFVKLVHSTTRSIFCMDYCM